MKVLEQTETDLSDEAILAIVDFFDSISVFVKAVRELLGLGTKIDKKYSARWVDNVA
jgi:hypothetical protein